MADEKEAKKETDQPKAPEPKAEEKPQNAEAKPTEAPKDQAPAEKPKEGTTGDAKGQPSRWKSLIMRLLPWIMMAGIVIVSAATGLGLGRLFAGSTQTDKAEDADPNQPPQTEQPAAEGAETASATAGKTWFYDFNPVVANLNEPGVTRYIRVVLTLEISDSLDAKTGNDFLNEKSPVMTNWLTIYLSGLTLEDIRGDKNLRRIQLQILDALNEVLFPDSKPQIKHVLFREFAIQ
jgi:flagellar basal body-associated protein FliL